MTIDSPSVGRLLSAATALLKQRVLLVEDDPRLQRLFQRVLVQAGFDVDVASNGEEASRLVLGADYCALVTDFGMPKMSGVELLRCVRVHDLDVPVILITGAPDMHMATEAIGHGVFQLLTKPIAPSLLVAEVTRAAKVHALAVTRRQAMRLLEVDAQDEAEKKELESAFTSVLSRFWMAYQPVVDRNGALYGYEALLRSDEPRLPNPLAVVDAAERLGHLPALGFATRERSAAEIAGADPNARLFVNLHARDLLDDTLLDPDSALFAIADRVVLEVTERASLHTLPDVAERIERLRAVGFRLAVDDLGAGYAGLSSFTTLRPEIVKIDMSIVRGVDQDPMKRTLVRMITGACADMGISVVAEGVERREERDSLLELGCDLFQGYFIAKPAKPFPTLAW